MPDVDGGVVKNIRKWDGGRSCEQSEMTRDGASRRVALDRRM